jgi:hypothetical protein
LSDSPLSGREPPSEVLAPLFWSVEHFAVLAVPLHPLETHGRTGQVSGEPFEPVAVAGLDDDLVVNRKPVV